MSLLGVDRRAWRALAAAQLGWMLDAMDFLLFTYAVIQIREEFDLSRPMMGALTSVALVASAGGGILFGHLADRIGRVRAMTFSIVLYSVATAGLATATALWHLVAWRILVGIGMRGLALPPASLALVNVALASVWLAVTFALAIRRERRCESVHAVASARAMA